MSLRLSLAQINPTVGDVSGNASKIIDWIGRSRKEGADVVLFPEMAVTGYPPEDLLLKADFVQVSIEAMKDIYASTRGITAVVGNISYQQTLYNSAYVIHDGRLAAVYHKHFLPNYGVFDEDRYFQAGRNHQVFKRNDFVFGVSICEDLWYPGGPASVQTSQGGAELLINISASPYSIGKGLFRERMLCTRAADNIAYLAYCNMVGGQDELVFDGHSLVIDPSGEVLARGSQFEEDLVVVDILFPQIARRRLLDTRLRKIFNNPGSEGKCETVELSPLPNLNKRELVGRKAEVLSDVSEIYSALVLGTRDYVLKNGFQKVVLGLSGGIDSSLVAAIAADALGAENVHGVAMPTRYSSKHSLRDAEALARNLGIDFRIISIDSAFQSFLDMLAPTFAGLPEDVTEENIQPRIRGTLLMALSNKYGWLVLTTGNKSEVGVGYSTLYGDTVGAYAVIKDVTKMMVYRLSHYRNKLQAREIIPEEVLVKPPSAELRPNQKDSDSLPPYDVLDQILCDYVELGHSPGEIEAEGFDAKTVHRVIGSIDRSEYKRRQSAPGVKVTQRAFGKDWRVPITHRYRGQ